MPPPISRIRPLSTPTHTGRSGAVRRRRCDSSDETPSAVKTKDFHYIGEMFQRATKLITGAEAGAWGMLGGVSGYCVAHALSLGITGSCVGVPLGFIAAAAVYTLINPREKVLLSCLQRAGLVFASNMITKEEYRAMRKQCIRAHEKAGP